MDFKKKLLFMLLMLSTVFLTGCISYVFSGAGLFYDRHTLYKKLSDFQLNAKISRELYKDEVFKCPYCSIDLAVFKGDVLLSGHVPTEALRQEANIRVTSIHGYRRFFDQLALRQSKGMSLQDDWITTTIRSQILAESSINPQDFKVVTSEQIVYLMGDVIPVEATKVINFARECRGVKRVVKLFKYYNLSDKAQ